MDEAARGPAKATVQTPLLATKLFMPRTRQNIVSRPQLTARLNACLDQKLTLVSAPAGFGKTTLLSTWARSLLAPHAWLTLDEADNDPVRFLSYLIAALQQIDAGAGRDIGRMLATAQIPSAKSMVTALVNDLAALPDDFLLILDDFHTIGGDPIYEAIQTLVTHQPPQMHLIIATREDPPLPLARLRARGELVELRASDLRFTLEETATFLNDIMGLALDQPSIDRLDAQIEGWVAGLQLAGLSLRDRPDRTELIGDISGNHHFILGYLTDEVLRGLPAEVQTFLVQTSVLTQLTGPLCDAVTGRTDSAAVLEELYTSNAFVAPLDDQHQWYRYHHLFADLLRGQLNRTEPKLAPELQRRASEWCEAHGAAADAIEYAFAAGDYPCVVRLLETHSRHIVLQGYARTVEEWLRRLPQAWRVRNPRSNLAFAWSLLLRGQLGEIEPYLRNAESAVAQPSDSGNSYGSQAIAAEILGLRAGVVSLRGDPEHGCELARQAVALAPHDDIYVHGTTLFCLGTAYNYAGKVSEAIDAYKQALPLCREAGSTVATMLIVANLSLLYTTRGKLHDAARLCREVIDAAERAGAAVAPPVATVYGSYGHILYEWNDLEAALRCAKKALTMSQHGGHVAAMAYETVLVSKLKLAQGDLEAAEACLRPGLELMQHGMPAWVKPQIIAQQVVLALARGDDVAMERLEQTGVRVDGPFHHTTEAIHIAYLRVLLNRGRSPAHAPDLRAALALSEHLLRAAEPAGRIGRAIEVLALRALLHQAQGDASQAFEDLNQVLALAEPEGYVRLFLNEGEAMANLLHAARERGIHRGYVTKLLALFPHQTDAVSTAQLGLIETLSERELAVLRLIAEGLTYEEVAQKLIVSVNTVRFHVKAIYGKLDVNKRTLAIDKARALHLI